MILSSMTKNGAILTAFALITTGTVALTHSLTTERIEEQEKQQLAEQLQQVLDAHHYDNQLYKDCVVITDERLGLYSL